MSETPPQDVHDDSDGDITPDDVPHDVVIQTALHDHLGGEWDALDGLVDACMVRLREYGRVVVRVCGCGQPVGRCHSCHKPRCWHCDPGLGKHHQPMTCNGQHAPAAAPVEGSHG